MLPPGKRPIPEIAAQPDPIHRLRDAATLLEFMLVRLRAEQGGNAEPERVEFGALVTDHERIFRNLGDVRWAIGVRNDVSHACGRRPEPTPSDIARAASHLLNACREVLPWLSAEWQEALQPPRSAQTKLAGGLTKAPVAPINARKLLKTGIALGIAGACLVGLLALGQRFWPVSADSPEGQRRLAARQAETQRVEATNAVRAQLHAQAERARKALGTATQLRKEIDRFAKEFVSLLENEQGRSVAADGTGVETLLILYDAPRPSAEEADALAKRIRDDLLKPIEAAAKSSTPTPPDKGRDTLIAEAQDTAERGVRAYTQLSDGARALLLANRGKDAGVTLALAFEQARTRHFQERQNAIQKAAAEERAAAATRLAEVEQRKVRAQAELDRQSQIAEAEKLEQARLRAVSKRASIIKIYEHMLGPGHVHWTVESTGARDTIGRYVAGFVRREIARPLSYTELTQAGVLSDWRAFAHFGDRRNYQFRSDNYCKLAFSENDRPGSAWGYPSTEQDVKIVQDRLDQFKTLAPFWIEQGKLAK